MPADKILLSIIMPVYNAGQLLERALKKIAEQGFTNYELLILDGSSTDNTVSIIEKAQATDKRIRFKTAPDKGIYDAMNKGIAMATGEWVYFTGCDDSFSDATVLEKISANLTDESDLVYGDINWMPENITESGVLTIHDLLNRNINHQRIFYRRSLFATWGDYDLQYKVAADHELNIRFFCNDVIRKKYIPLLIADYHSGGFSAGKLDAVFWNNWKDIFRKNFSTHLPDKDMYNKLGWYCRYQIDRYHYGRAFVLFWDVFIHTFSPGFVWLSFRQPIQSMYKRAS